MFRLGFACHSQRNAGRKEGGSNGTTQLSLKGRQGNPQVLITLRESKARAVNMTSTAEGTAMSPRGLGPGTGVVGSGHSGRESDLSPPVKPTASMHCSVCKEY